MSVKLLVLLSLAFFHTYIHFATSNHIKIIPNPVLSPHVCNVRSYHCQCGLLAAVAKLFPTLLRQFCGVYSALAADIQGYAMSFGRNLSFIPSQNLSVFFLGDDLLT